MRAAIGTMNDVVQLETSSRATAVDAAATTITAPYQTRDTGRNVLIRTLRRRTIDRSDVLGIAQCTVDRFRRDRQLSTRTLLPAPTAASAHHGTHFMFQGHENGARGAGTITRINLDADAAHRVTVMAMCG